MHDAKNKLINRRRMTVGCGMRADKCLALGVDARDGRWNVRWALFGQLSRENDPAYVEGLRKKVGRMHLWTSLAGSMAEQDQVACAIDLALPLDGKRIHRISARDQDAMLKSQLRGRLLNPAEPYEIVCDKTRGPSGEPQMLGAAARTHDVDEQYKFWQRTIRIPNPHLGSPAVALANVYLALYPENKRSLAVSRLLICEGAESTVACCMDHERVLETFYFRKIAGHGLGAPMVQQWQQMCKERYELKMAPVAVCVVPPQTGSDLVPVVEVWNPFEDARVVVAAEARATVEAYPDLSSIAFGMALQGA
jgi:hypothetical protein